MRQGVNNAGKSISIHAAQEGCDVEELAISSTTLNFNPRSPNGLRRKRFDNDPAQMLISIHAARVGCDTKSEDVQKLMGGISIHAARVGCDLKLVAVV